MTLEKPGEKPGLPNPSYSPEPVREPRKLAIRIGIALAAFLVLLGGLFWWADRYRDSTEHTEQTGMAPNESRSGETPELDVSTVLAGRQHIWDIAFLPAGTMLYTERGGALNIVREGESHLLEDISDVAARGEGGLMGLAVDPLFDDNNYIYTCFNSTSGDIRVVRWKVSDEATNVTGRTDIATGMPANPSGRHSGCRLAFGLDGYLWIGTGDSAQSLTPQSPQDPKSLGGKILRVDRNGKAAPDNVGGTFDARIYSYGHRNTQGLAFFGQEIDGVSGISTEHGPGIDDEVNLLKPGNFGWAPPNGSYNESVPMTDTSRFPGAVEAIWSSGNPTLAPSGAAVLKGSQWKAWDGSVIVAMLKTQHLRILVLDDNLNVAKEEIRLADEYGRLRAVTLGPDGSLYVSTSNGTDDKILRITPR